VFGVHRLGGDILEPQSVLKVLRQAAGRSKAFEDDGMKRLTE
jgi:hypothetical protein